MLQTNKKKTTPWKNGQSLKADYLQKVNILRVFREMQIKTKEHFMPIRLVEMSKVDNTESW